MSGDDGFGRWEQMSNVILVTETKENRKIKTKEYILEWFDVGSYGNRVWK